MKPLEGWRKEGQKRPLLDLRGADNFQRVKKLQELQESTGNDRNTKMGIWQEMSLGLPKNFTSAKA